MIAHFIQLVLQTLSVTVLPVHVQKLQRAVLLAGDHLQRGQDLPAISTCTIVMAGCIKPLSGIRAAGVVANSPYYFN